MINSIERTNTVLTAFTYQHTTKEYEENLSAAVRSTHRRSTDSLVMRETDSHLHFLHIRFLYYYSSSVFYIHLFTQHTAQEPTYRM